MVAAHNLLSVGQLSDAGSEIGFAEALYLWAKQQLPPDALDPSDEASEEAYLYDYRIRRATAQFLTLRGLISPPMKERIIEERPVRVYRSLIFGRDSDSPVRPIAAEIAHAMTAIAANGEDQANDGMAQLRPLIRDLNAYLQDNSEEQLSTDLNILREILGPNFIRDVFMPIVRQLAEEEEHDA